MHLPENFGRNCKTVEELKALIVSYEDFVKDEIADLCKSHGGDLRCGLHAETGECTDTLYFYFNTVELRDEFYKKAREFCTIFVNQDMHGDKYSCGTLGYRVY